METEHVDFDELKRDLLQFLELSSIKKNNPHVSLSEILQFRILFRSFFSGEKERKIHLDEALFNQEFSEFLASKGFCSRRIITTRDFYAMLEKIEIENLLKNE